MTRSRFVSSVTLDEVIARASSHPTFGLGSGVRTRDVSKAHRLAKGIRAGSVWVNCYQAMDPAVPFGGYKMSGYGRESGSAAARGVPEREGGLDQDGVTPALVGVLASGRRRPAPAGRSHASPFMAYRIQILGLSEKRDD